MAVKHVLLVDDSKSARLVLRRLLEKSSLEVDLAESAEEALDYLQDKQPDVIFMDHMMPGMDGLEATKLISTNPKTHGIPVVMCTSKEGEAFSAEAKAHGAIDVICKPPKPSIVSKVLSLLSDGKPASSSITSDTLADAREIMPEVIQEIIPEPIPSTTPDNEIALETGSTNLSVEEIKSIINIALKQTISGEITPLLKSLVHSQLQEQLESHQPATKNNNNHVIENQIKELALSTATLQAQFSDLPNTIFTAIEDKLTSNETDNSYIDTAIQRSENTLNQLINDKILSLSELMEGSASTYNQQMHDIAEKQTEKIVGEELNALKNKVEAQALNETELKQSLMNELKEASTQQISKVRTLALISSTLGVLSIGLASTVFYLLTSTG